MSPKNSRTCLVLDAGTTGIKAFAFDEAGNQLAREYELLPTRREKDVVEQDPLGMVEMSRRVLKKIKDGIQNEVTVLAITNQRETVMAWDMKTRQPLGPAIVWQDARGQEYVDEWKPRGGEIQAKTGLIPDTYFSAPKIRWMLDHVQSARALAEAGALAVGTVDSWLLWNMTGGQATDMTNASRTMCFNIRELGWDKGLLELYGIPENILPQVYPSRHDFGVVDGSWGLGDVPVMAVCGDQQGSFEAAQHVSGDALATKVTFGTGIFLLQGLGSEFQLVDSGFTTLTARSAVGRPEYAVEIKVEMPRVWDDGLLHNPDELKAFLGEMAAAVAKALPKLPKAPQELVIDGGMTRDGILAKALHDITGLPIKTQATFDATALGAAQLALGL